jgi:hypothetical protein
VPGDTNGDGGVNLTDLSALLGNFGKSGMTLAQGDVDGSGLINSFDLTLILANFGK